MIIHQPHYINANPIKKIAAIHDLSSIGRCALTAVIPVLSVMGLQVIPLPTALLSTQTDGYRNFSFLDLSEQMTSTTEHWSSLDITFDAIYSGFLASARQIEIVSNFIDRFRGRDTIVIIDPVMGDDGLPYPTITSDMQRNMTLLVAKADILIPNITEACFLLGREKTPVHTDGVDDTDDIANMLFALSALGPKNIVITGIHSANGKIGNAYLDADRKPTYYYHDAVPKSYPGTGDILASVISGRLCLGDTLGDAVICASDFVYDVIYDTAQFNSPRREGVLLERHLYKLIKQ